MKFHGVLEDIFGTVERIKILRVLARHSKEFTSRELSGYCGVSVRGVIDILGLFERHEFVKSRRVGNSILWKLDAGHHITKSIVLPTFAAGEGLIDRLKGEISASLKEYPVARAVIYGSVARGEERPDSDVDLLLVVKEKGMWVEGLQAGLREKVLNSFGNMLSVLVYTPNEYKRISPTLKKDMENGIVVTGD